MAKEYEFTVVNQAAYGQPAYGQLIGGPVNGLQAAQLDLANFRSLVENRKYNIGELIVTDDHRLKCVNNHVHSTRKNNYSTSPEENRRVRQLLYSVLTQADEYWCLHTDTLQEILIGENVLDRPLERDMAKMLVTRKSTFVSNCSDKRTTMQLTGRDEDLDFDSFKDMYTNFSTHMSRRFIRRGYAYPEGLNMTNRNEEKSFGLYNFDVVLNGVGGVKDLFAEACNGEFKAFEELVKLTAIVLEKKGIITSAERRNVDLIHEWDSRGDHDTFREIFDEINELGGNNYKKFSTFALWMARLLKNYTIAVTECTKQDAARAGFTIPKATRVLTVRGNRDPLYSTDLFRNRERARTPRRYIYGSEVYDRDEENADEVELRSVIEGLSESMYGEQIQDDDEESV